MMNASVLHVVYNLIRGGTEGQCARVAIGLAQRGFRQRVAAFRREGFFLAPVESACGPVHEVRIRHMCRASTLCEVWRLRSLIRREGVALVHAWDADAAIFGSLAARLAGVPWITSRRDLGHIYPAYKLALMRMADRGARSVVVNAEAIEAQLVSGGFPAERIVRIPNIMDLPEFDRLAEATLSKCDLLPAGRLIVMVSRLDPEKDTEAVIRAFARIASELGDVSLVVAGDGPERERCESLAAQTAPPGRVVFLGETTDVPALLRRCALGVLAPRSNEGASNSILEYMAAGLPVVATDCGGNRELLDDGANGVLVPVGDVEALADAFGAVLSDLDAAARMGRSGRRRVETIHEPGAVLDAFSRLYSRTTKDL